ncbi:MAG: hypothetical protein JNM39_09785 [Bdellovibrionaceae bacterium]|nr:hypothetical protein [Pseudobdellovibrionaceae bacterium]
MKPIKSILESPYRFLLVVAVLFCILLWHNGPNEKPLYRLTDLFQELIALGILVAVFEASHSKRDEMERSKSTRRAIAWLISPNSLQVDSKAWVAKFKNTGNIPNQPMPFREVRSFYYEILLLAVKMPDFVEFSRELNCLKEAMKLSDEWDVKRTIYVNQSQVNYAPQNHDDYLSKVESCANVIKDVWLPQEATILLGKINEK